MPETVCDQCTMEVTGRVGDTPIHVSFGDESRNANLSESWHSVHRIGWAKGSYFPAREG